jgi:hypothetical protein
VTEKGLLLASAGPFLRPQVLGSELCSLGPVVKSEELKFLATSPIAELKRRAQPTPNLLHGSEPVLEGHQIDVQDHHVSNERLEADNAPDPSKFGLGLFRTGPCESTRGWVCRRKVGTRT